MNPKVKIVKSSEDVILKVPSEILFPLTVIIALKFVIRDHEFPTSYSWIHTSVCYFLNSPTAAFWLGVEIFSRCHSLASLLMFIAAHTIAAALQIFLTLI